MIDTLQTNDINLRFSDARLFYDNCAKVQINEKWGRIDVSGKEIIPIIYDEVKNC